ncbi:ACT domain-containing protein [Candidatus Poribacteria bacterium]|nr:ACT domain-containing protein [Candidatus Poribacteria bacterium]
MQHDRFILTVVGKDHPGIVAGISHVLYEYECNIQEINQTVLSDEFAMILLLRPTKDIDVEDLRNSLEIRCSEMDVSYSLRPATVPDEIEYGKKLHADMDRVVITVIGDDRIGIVAGVTKALADRNINILELSTAPSYIIHGRPEYTMVARVEIDDGISLSELREALDKCSRELSVEINIQSQQIFNAMHKV